MASDTKNVKVGVCRISYDGVDLGYTKGGVEVEVTTETYRSEVDQFGKSVINEIIMGRNVKAKVPLAETTIDNMVRIMPGATLVQTGGAKATGTITLSTNPVNNQTLLVNGQTITFKTAAAGPLEVTIGASAAATAAALTSVLNLSSVGAIAAAAYSVVGAVVTVTYDNFGVAGNAFTLGAGTSGATVSGATLSGGTDTTSMRVEVVDAVGTSLIESAKELRLHPQQLADTDLSEDFVIPLASTAGAITFAYKLEEERVFNTEFSGYPNPVTRKLFHFGS